MKLRKVVTVLTAASVACGLLAGCGGDAKETSSDKEILLWSSATGPDGERIKATIDEYNKTNPELKVKFVSMQADTFNTKLTTAGKSGKGVPDSHWFLLKVFLHIVHRECLRNGIPILREQN